MTTLTNLHWEIPPAGAYEFGSLQADLTDVPALPHDSIYARFYNSSDALLVIKILSPLEQRRSDGSMHIYIPGSAVQPNGLAYATAITRLELEDTAGTRTSFSITSRVSPDRGTASVRHTSLSDDTTVTVMGARIDAWTDAFDFASLTVRTDTGDPLVTFPSPSIDAGAAVLSSSTTWPDGLLLASAKLVTLDSTGEAGVVDWLQYKTLAPVFGTNSITFDTPVSLIPGVDYWYITQNCAQSAQAEGTWGCTLTGISATPGMFYSTSGGGFGTTNDVRYPVFTMHAASGPDASISYGPADDYWGAPTSVAQKFQVTEPITVTGLSAYWGSATTTGNWGLAVGLSGSPRYQILNCLPDWVLTADFAASRVAFSFPNTR